MNEKAKTLFKNLNYSVNANLLVLVVSVVLNLVIPKFVGVTEYSYWQLYVFYSSYVGFFHLGWIDGIYLKLGGQHYEDLDKKTIRTQFFYLFIFQMILASILILYTFLFVVDRNKMIIYLSTSVILILMNLKTFILFILQSTNRIKEYAKLSVSDRYLYIIFVLIYLFTGGKNFVILILLDVLTKGIVTLWGILVMKDITFGDKYKYAEISNEIKDNIKIGSNLMLGNIASMLILGISRVLVEQKWSIETFGELSFALSVSNMFMLFISSVSIVLYPLLRRTSEDKLSILYLRVRELFVPFTLVLLLFFNPIKFILEWWLPEYQISLFYMGILFPMIVYEGRISLLVNTYLKTIRQEKIILIANIFSLFIAVTSSLISVFIFQNISLTVLSIIISLAFRCVIAETMLSRVLKIKLNIENIIEGVIILIFIACNIYLSAFGSFIVYLLVIILYSAKNYLGIKNSLNFFLLLLVKEKRV